MNNTLQNPTSAQSVGVEEKLERFRIEFSRGCQPEDDFGLEAFKQELALERTKTARDPDI